jgi:glutathione S-transferase
LLEELNLDYEIKVFKRGSNFRAGDDLKAVHPLGKSPVIGITPAGSEKEIIVAESETIVEYVCEHFGRHMIPQRYPEGKEGVLGAENDEFMRYRVCLLLSLGRWLCEVISLPTAEHQLHVVVDHHKFWPPMIYCAAQCCASSSHYANL